MSHGLSNELCQMLLIELPGQKCVTDTSGAEVGKDD